MKLTKHKRVLIPVKDELDPFSSIFHEKKENVYVLTKSELRKFAADAVWASCNNVNIDEFLKQNIEL